MNLNAARLEQKRTAVSNRFCKFPRAEGGTCSNWALKDAHFCGVHVCSHYANMARCKEPVEYKREYYTGDLGDGGAEKIEYLRWSVLRGQYGSRIPDKFTFHGLNKRVPIIRLDHDSSFFLSFFSFSLFSSFSFFRLDHECKLHASTRQAFHGAVRSEVRTFAEAPDSYAPLLELLDGAGERLQAVRDWVSRSRPLTAICSDIVEDALSSMISDLSSMMFVKSYQPQSLLLYEMRRSDPRDQMLLNMLSGRLHSFNDLNPTVYSEDQNVLPKDVQFGPLSWAVRPMKENGFSCEKEQQGGVFPTAACFRPPDTLDSSLALCLRNRKVLSNFDEPSGISKCTICL